MQPESEIHERLTAIEAWVAEAKRLIPKYRGDWHPIHDLQVQAETLRWVLGLPISAPEDASKNPNDPTAVTQS